MTATLKDIAKRLTTTDTYEANEKLYQSAKAFLDRGSVDAMKSAEKDALAGTNSTQYLADHKQDIASLLEIARQGSATDKDVAFRLLTLLEPPVLDIRYESTSIRRQRGESSASRVIYKVTGDKTVTSTVSGSGRVTLGRPLPVTTDVLGSGQIRFKPS